MIECIAALNSDLRDSNSYMYVGIVMFQEAVDLNSKTFQSRKGAVTL